MCSFFSRDKENEEENDKESYTDLDDAVQYFSTDPSGLLESIMSSDISLIEIQVTERNAKEFLNVLRIATSRLKSKQTFPSFIDGNAHTVYLRDFILLGSDGDISSSLDKFFTLSRNYLKQYKEVSPYETNHRLAGSVTASLIRIKEVFAGLEYGSDQ